MRWTSTRPLLCFGVAVALLVVVAPAGARRSTARTKSAQAYNCLSHVAHTTNYYTPGCTGHDEPELDPVALAEAGRHVGASRRRQVEDRHRRAVRREQLGRSPGHARRTTHDDRLLAFDLHVASRSCDERPASAGQRPSL